MHDSQNVNMIHWCVTVCVCVFACELHGRGCSSSPAGPGLISYHFVTH